MQTELFTRRNRELLSLSLSSSRWNPPGNHCAVSVLLVLRVRTAQRIIQPPSMMYNLHKSTRVSATFFSFFLSLSSHENSSIPRKTSCKIHARAGIILVTLEFAPLSFSLFLERRRWEEGRRDFESMENGREGRSCSFLRRLKESKMSLTGTIREDKYRRPLCIARKINRPSSSA